MKQDLCSAHSALDEKVLVGSGVSDGNTGLYSIPVYLVLSLRVLPVPPQMKTRGLDRWTDGPSRNIGNQEKIWRFTPSTSPLICLSIYYFFFSKRRKYPCSVTSALPWPQVSVLQHYGKVFLSKCWSDGLMMVHHRTT